MSVFEPVLFNNIDIGVPSLWGYFYAGGHLFVGYNQAVVDWNQEYVWEPLDLPSEINSFPTVVQYAQGLPEFHEA